MSTFEERANKLAVQSSNIDVMNKFTIDSENGVITYDDDDFLLRCTVVITRHAVNHFDVRCKGSLDREFFQHTGLSIWGLQAAFEYIDETYVTGLFWAFRSWAMDLGYEVK